MNLNLQADGAAGQSAFSVVEKALSTIRRKQPTSGHPMKSKSPVQKIRLPGSSSQSKPPKIPAHIRANIQKMVKPPEASTEKSPAKFLDLNALVNGLVCGQVEASESEDAVWFRSLLAQPIYRSWVPVKLTDDQINRIKSMTPHDVISVVLAEYDSMKSASSRDLFFGKWHWAVKFALAKAEKKRDALETAFTERVQALPDWEMQRAFKKNFSALILSL